MATADALLGLGLPSSLAGALGNQIQAVTCAGTSSGTATAINDGARVVLLTGASSQTGAILPTNAGVGDVWYIFGVGSAAPVIYMPGSQKINSNATSLTLSAAVSGAVLVKTSSTQWYSVPLAP